LIFGLRPLIKHFITPKEPLNSIGFNKKTIKKGDANHKLASPLSYLAVCQSIGFDKIPVIFL